MRFDILTLFPALVEQICSTSILGRARAAGLVEIYAHDIRAYSADKHRRVDDTPYGGGAGMLMAAPPIVACYEAVAGMSDIPSARTLVLYLSPAGRVFNQTIARELAAWDRLILLCGHYEGVDARALALIGARELSVGDFVVTGGEIPACLVVDAVARLLPGVLAEPACHEVESISWGLLEYPQYTRPEVFRDLSVPRELLSGDHEAIARLRYEQALAKTKLTRPDLL